MSKRRKRHSPEQIVKKLRDAEAMLNGGQDLAAVLQGLEVSEATYNRWRPIDVPFVTFGTVNVSTHDNHENSAGCLD